MVSTKLKLPMFYFNVRDFEEPRSQLFADARKVFLKLAQYSQENTYVGVFFNKAAGLRDCNYIKKRLQNRCFPVKIAKFLRRACSQNTAVGCFYRCSIKKLFRKVPQTSLECNVIEVLFLSRSRPITCNFVKVESPAQVFCCEFCEIYSEQFFAEQV